jgi:hypothetical protein
MSKGKSRALSIFRRKVAVEPPPTPSGLGLLLSGPPASRVPVPAAPAAPVKPVPRPRLVFAVDATSSRAAAWEAAKKLTDALFAALPGELEVALAVHGGSRVHTFTPFLPDAGALRPLAARVRCQAGYTKLLDILGRVLELEDVGVVVYVGDVFEESEKQARKTADALAKRGTRVIILHDTGGQDLDEGHIFADIATRTGGAVLPFNSSALEPLGEMLEAISVLAVGGTELLKTKQESMPAATLLLEHLDGGRRIGRR